LLLMQPAGITITGEQWWCQLIESNF